MSTLQSARERARTEIRREILAKAREHLGDHGAAALSLRAVARDLGLVPSAVYRYFENRDALLTALIVEAYDSLGAAAEAATAATQGEPPRLRWLRTAQTVRAWALDHRNEYFLLYGAPVPGYAAPDDTVVPGTRVSLALVQIVVDARNSGQLTTPLHGPGGVASHPVDDGLRSELSALATAIAPGVASDTVFRTVLAWTQLFGLLSFELFGQTRGMVSGSETLFAEAATAMAAEIGL